MRTIISWTKDAITFSDGEIEEANKVDWSCISRRQQLSEEFIREFNDKVNWYAISRYHRWRRA